MKNRYLSGLLCAVVLFPVLPANAQITITSNDMPKSGDTLRYSSGQAGTTPLGLSTTGANQSWDYSFLTPTSQDVYSYKAANQTPYVLYFFGQTGLKTADSLGVSPLLFTDIYSFYTKTSSLFKAEGIGYRVSGVPLGSMYKDDDEIYQFPLNFGDKDTSTFNFKFSVPGGTIPFYYVQKGTRINVVDGWGSIKTPYKTYSSVLRVRTQITQVDTLSAGGFPVPIPRTTVEYKWLANGERIPVLEISGTLVAGNFTPNRIRYRDQYRSLLSPLRPTAAYTIDKTSGYAGDVFNFTDKSLRVPTAWKWEFTPSAGVAFTGGTSATSQNPKVTFGNQGLYSVRLIATNLFGSDDTVISNQITISFGTSASHPDAALVKVYPNPGQQYVNITAPFSIESVEVNDAAGKRVLISKSENGVLNISTLKPGTYFMRVSGRSGEMTVAELIRSE